MLEEAITSVFFSRFLSRHFFDLFSFTGRCLSNSNHLDIPFEA